MPSPPSAAGRGGRRGNPAQPVGQQHRDRQGADAAAACARRNRRAASPPMPIRRPGSASRRPTSPGTARPASSRSASRCARRRASAPARRSRSPMSMSAASARSACARTRSATMRGLAAARARRPFRRDRIRLRAAVRPARPQAPRSSASRSCRPTRRCCATIATRPTTSRCRAWRNGCKSTGLKRLVIGVSGGLDSTQALIVSARVMDPLGLPRANILAYTLPGFATSSGTKSNAWRLMRALGVTGAEIDIRPAAKQMLADIGHASAKGEALYDVTFENVQAGLRTDYLFRLANHNGGLVVGTGDLSELALGWCTYGVGDQMSHYNPNASVSKTLIQHLIRFVANSGDVGAETAAVLLDILGDRDFAGAGAGRRRRRDPVDRERCRPLRAAGFQPVLYDALRLRAVEDRLSVVERVARRRSRARGRPIPRRARGAPSICPRSSTGCASFCGGFSSRASSSARPCRTGRRFRRAARCRRAATGARRPIRTPRSGSTNSSATSRIRSSRPRMTPGITTPGITNCA